MACSIIEFRGASRFGWSGREIPHLQHSWNYARHEHRERGWDRSAAPAAFQAGNIDSRELFASVSAVATSSIVSEANCVKWVDRVPAYFGRSVR